MRIPSQFGFVVGGAAALALLAGCSGSSTGTSPTLPSGNGLTTQSISHRAPASRSYNVLPQRMQSKVHSSISSGIIGKAGSCPSAPVGFISDYEENEIFELDEAGTVCATLTGYTNPQGLSTDHSGNLWVANTGASNILEVNPSTGAVEGTLNDPNEFPVDVAVNNSGSCVAATNILTTSDSAGNVVFYGSGATSPTGTASASNYTSPRFLAFDKQQNAVVLDDYDEFNTGAVNVGAVLTGGCSGTKNIVPLSTSNSINFPGGVQINQSGNPVIDDQSSSPASLYTYTVSGTTLTLSQTTPMNGSSDPVSFAFAPVSGYHLFLTADAGLISGCTYPYPTGGSGTCYPVPGALPIGAAIIPTAQFAFQHHV
jgi:hypothetical protein